MPRDADHVFRDAPERVEARVTEIHGRVPPGLRGSLLRIGPGAQHVPGAPLHFFDVEGFVAALRFDGGDAWLRARHVGTPAWLAERAAGKRLFRRPFTNLPGGRLANLLQRSLGNAAAHGVHAWGGSIVAADAPGHFLLAADTLLPIGPAPVDAWIDPPAVLSPMARVDPVTGHLTLYAMTPGLVATDTVVFHEIDAAWRRAQSVTVRLPARGSALHDHAFSQRYWVVVEFGRRSVASALVGGGSAFDAIGFDVRNPVHLFLAPRDAAGSIDAVAVPLPPGQQCFHIVNAYDDGDALVVDLVLYDGRVDYRELFPPASRRRHGASAPVVGPALWRYVIDPRTGRARSRMIEGVTGEAPTVHPRWMGRRHRWAYMASPTERGDEPVDHHHVWFHGLAKVDYDDDQHACWSAGRRQFVSPPAFAPRPGATDEDDGWVLAWTIDAARERSTVVILDARDLAGGPVATLVLPTLLPGVSHVAWAPS